jgi:hypothetical protein
VTEITRPLHSCAAGRAYRSESGKQTDARKLRCSRMALRILQVLSLLLVAVAMSFALAHVAELPGKRRLDRDTYLAMQTVYHPGFTVGGISEPVSIVSLAVLLLLTARHAPAFGWTGVAFAAVIGMQVVYWLVTHPINRFWLQGRQLPRASMAFFGVGRAASATEYDSADWVRIRNRWEYSHVLRASLAVVGLISLAIAVTEVRK